MKHTFVFLSLLLCSAVLIHGCSQAVVAEGANQELFGQFKNFSDSTLGVDFAREKLIYDSVRAHVGHSDYVISLFAKKVSNVGGSLNITMLFIALNDKTARGEIFNARDSVITSRRFSFGREYFDRFEFVFFCNNHIVKLKDTSSALVEYSLVMVDANGLEQFTVRKDTSGAELENYPGSCDAYWIEENANFIDQLIGLANGEPANYEF